MLELWRNHNGVLQRLVAFMMDFFQSRLGKQTPGREWGWCEHFSSSSINAVYICRVSIPQESPRGKLLKTAAINLRYLHNSISAREWLWECFSACSFSLTSVSHFPPFIHFKYEGLIEWQAPCLFWGASWGPGVRQCSNEASRCLRSRTSV